MFTIFATPKAFEGQFVRIQENAIVSWTKIKPKCEIILLGNENGVSKIAKKYHLKHIPDVKLSESGTPIVSDLFSRAQKEAKFPILAYINSDVILLDDFPQIIQKLNLKSFMIVGHRWELEVTRKIDFSKDWRRKLSIELREKGHIKSNKAVDYFIFPKDLNLDIPPFVIGRWVWDNWFLYQAKKKKIPLIDATWLITAIHQIHDYSHAGGFDAIWYGKEHQVNLELTPDKRRSFNLLNVDWILTSEGLTRPKNSSYRFWRALRVYPILHPWVSFILPVIICIQFFLDQFRKRLKQ